ncbi:MAG: MBL fold metallo-hydrolase [Clostridia bacterium]|nr:MBL fold metallo-hydrolase [Clostridia bacterium]
MNFTYTEYFPHVYHIGDKLGAHMTLIAGSKRALLVDAGYGMEDVYAFIRTLTHLPVCTLLTHAHHDHALGAMHLPEVWLLEADQAAFSRYTSTAQRQKVLEQARAKGIPPPDGFLTIPIPIQYQKGACTLDLGGITADIIPCPGHTPGSLVVYIPQYRLLLTGDNWNTCTWLFFPEALGVREYLQNVRKLFELPFEHVLCSHQGALYPRSKMEQFFDALTEENLMNAAPVSMGWEIDTRQVNIHPDQLFVFDFGKFQPYTGEENR